MPGSKPYEAYSAFVGPLANALACVATAKMVASPGGKTDLERVHTLHLTGINDNDDFVVLAGKARLELFGRIYYEIIRDSRPGYGPYRVTTRGYLYSLRTADKTGVYDFHWHPLSRSSERKPHMHLGSSQLNPDAVLSKKDHIYTGRITFESVIRNAIGLGAEPRFENWEDRLMACEAPHLKHRSWG